MYIYVCILVCIYICTYMGIYMYLCVYMYVCVYPFKTNSDYHEIILFFSVTIRIIWWHFTVMGVCGLWVVGCGKMISDNVTSISPSVLFCY